ncbi:alpha/beta fold hydrolase [bacterium]|nr:alpha/beta fold hydrolase [bacterium]
MNVTPDPFWLEGGEVGVLMIHGFTGSPSELRPVAEALHGQGWTVFAPLLPGHGTHVSEMNQCRFSHWTAAVDAALDELKGRCSSVVVAGQSMGALLVLDLAARRGDEIAGVIAYASALIPTDRLSFMVPLIKHFIKTMPKGPNDFVDKRAVDRLWDYDVNPIPAAHELFKLAAQVRSELGQIRTPLLLLHSRDDRVIDARSSQIVYDQVAASQKELFFLEGCGHVLTLDVHWPGVAQRSIDFVRQVATNKE